MNTAAFVLAVVAGALGVAEVVTGRVLAGLAVVTLAVALIVALATHSTSTVTF